MPVYTMEIRLEGIDDLSPVLRRAERDVNAASRDIEGSLGGVASQLRDVARTGERSMSRLGQSIENVGSRMQNLGDAIRPVGFALAGVGAALLGPVTLGVRKAATFEQQMQGVRAVTELTDEEFQRLSETAQELGAVTPFTAEEAAQAFEILAKAGFSVQEMLDAIAPTLQLAGAGGLELEQAASILVRTLRGMNMETAEAQRAVDVLAQAANKSTADVDELGQSFSLAAAIGRQAGMSVEELAAIFGVLSDAGTVATRAGTGVQAVLREMSAPSKQQRELMEELGLSFFDAQGNMRPMADIVEQLENAFEGMGEQSRLAALNILFLDQGARVMGNLITRGSDSLREMEKSLDAAGGAAERMQKERLKGLMGAWELFMGELDVLLNTIGNTFLPVLTKIVQVLESVTAAFNRLPGPVKAVGAVLMAVAGTLAAVSGAMILLLGPFGSLLTGFGRFVAIVGPLTSGFGRLAATIVSRVVPAMVSLVISMGPIGIALTALAAVVGVFALAWAKNWGGIREKTKAAIDAVVGFFKSLWTGVTNIVGAVVGFIRDRWQEIATILSIFIGGPLAALGVAWATNAFGIRDTMSNLAESIRGFFADLAGNALEMGKRIITGLWEGIKGAVGGLLESVKNVGRSVLDAMKSGLGKLWPFSPSEAGVDIGTGLIQGISAGIRDAERYIDRDLAMLERKVTGGFRTRFDTGRLVPAGAKVLNVTVNVDRPVVQSRDDARRLGDEVASRVRLASVGM